MIKKLGWLLMGLMALVAGCGGGSTVASSGGVGSGGTGSYTSGPVSGLGSIIVNGVRYDISNAAVQDDEDSVGLDETRLQLGMWVEVKGSAITAGSGGKTDTATATSVKFASDFIGRVTAVSPSAAAPTSITLFGRSIAIDSKTVYTSPINVGDYVVVYGLVSDGSYVATRIDHLTVVPTEFKLSGVVRNLNATTFSLGTQTLTYGPGTSGIAGLRNGAVVRVKVASTPWAPGVWVATKVRAPAAAVRNSQEARVLGLISALTDQKHFVVNGVSVVVTSLPAATLAEGTRVDVTGKMVDGILVANGSDVEVESQADVDGRDIELHGRASAVGLGVFTVRGVTVSYTPSESVPVLDLECVEVRGTSYNAANQLIAKSISRESDCR